MPLVRIDVPDTLTAQERQTISQGVHQAMVNTINVPPDDLFQTMTLRAPHEMICTRSFLGISHSPCVVFVQITLSPGRTIDMKKALFAKITETVAAATTVSPNDVIINLVETARENWSFGNGIAQYV